MQVVPGEEAISALQRLSPKPSVLPKPGTPTQKHYPRPVVKKLLDPALNGLKMASI